MTAPDLTPAEAELLRAWRAAVQAEVEAALRAQLAPIADAAAAREIAGEGLPVVPGLLGRHDWPAGFDIARRPGRTTRAIEAALRQARAGARVLYVVASRPERDHAARILERLLGDDAGDLLTCGRAALEVAWPEAGVLRVAVVGSRDAPPARGWQVTLDHAALDQVPADTAAAWRRATGRKLAVRP